ncbi:hypothetical protein OF829_13325 [Sphingomonas sp. LB-2]|uniref:hypothetical protein n=1 Tax=Sphingomonas caeni TaxID=2984949 RepID=UPI00223296A1|nr:hypothetical protein [Sphingomonas caeni]MCW3848221.1 hypothetical protein [Sphingomonas caeni]
MRRTTLSLGLALALILLPAAPALADWGKTHWGMSPEQVLAAVPGAKPLKRENGGDVWGRQRLISAPYKLGKFATNADFFFTSQTRTLDFVKMEPVDPKQCPALEAMLAKRHGKGESETRENAGIQMRVIRWTDRKTREQLLYSSLNKAGQPIARCHFIQQAPE